VLILFYCFLCFVFYFVCSEIFIVSAYIHGILLLCAFCVQVQGPLPPGGNRIAVNKYYILKTLKRGSCWLKLVCNSVLPVSLKVVFLHCCSSCASTGTLTLYITHPLKVSSALPTLKCKSVLNFMFTLKYTNWNQRERVEHTWPFYYVGIRSLEVVGWSTKCLGHFSPAK
jgi:hypothetical protein